MGSKTWYLHRLATLYYPTVNLKPTLACNINNVKNSIQSSLNVDV